MILKKTQNIGIVSYGAQLPKFKILGEEIARAQGKEEQKLHKALGVSSKTVPGIDEDTITLSTASGYQAISRLQILGCLKKTSSIDNLNSKKAKIDSIFIGSESHPYAVKPSGTVVAQALGIASDTGKPLATADLQFACKAGTQSLQISALYVGSGFCEYALAIGTDTAQAAPGDVLEYTAGAGSAAFILGRDNKSVPVLAKLLATTSIATDTPDFWRRPKESYPQHAGRFTGKPGYFAHIELATKQILAETNMKPDDFDRCVFHSPNAKFPKAIAKKLGFSEKQLEASMVVETIGNTYAGSSLLGLVNTLDIAKENEKVLVVSYGSGAGSDAFIFETTPALTEARKIWQVEEVTKTLLQDQIKKLVPIKYEQYRKNSSH